MYTIPFSLSSRWPNWTSQRRGWWIWCCNQRKETKARKARVERVELLKKIYRAAIFWKITIIGSLSKKISISAKMFSELPLELLSQIFSYLPLSDRLQCNLVCKHWHWAFLDPKLHEDQTILKIEEDEHFLASITNSATCESSLLESEVTTAVRHLVCDKLNVNIFSPKYSQAKRAI